jgi:hypothetical protein
VFYFPSGGLELYGSLYVPLSEARQHGIVICGSWGVEADRTYGMLRELALASARLGIAAMVFHYPGQGDSLGITRDSTLADLTQSTIDAAAEASRRRQVEWIFVGLRIGALPAARAASADESRRVLLIQPSLDPSAYFAELATSARRARLGVAAAEGVVFGYAVPPAVHDDRDPMGEVASRGPLAGAIVRYAGPTPVDPVLHSLELIERPGRWRFQHAHHPELSGAALRWLDATTVASR